MIFLPQDDENANPKWRALLEEARKLNAAWDETQRLRKESLELQQSAEAQLPEVKNTSLDIEDGRHTPP